MRTFSISEHGRATGILHISWFPINICYRHERKCILSVSYTHLDVYKRQEEWPAKLWNVVSFYLRKVSCIRWMRVVKVYGWYTRQVQYITSTKSTNKVSICRLKKKCTFKWDANNPLKKDRQSLMMSNDNPNASRTVRNASPNSWMRISFKLLPISFSTCIILSCCNTRLRLMLV